MPSRNNSRLVRFGLVACFFLLFSPVIAVKRFTDFHNCTPGALADFNQAHNTAYQNPLTIAQCEEVCGEGYGPYSWLNVLESVTTWFIPLCFLAGNMNYARVGSLGHWNYLATAAHLLGDPIGTMMNLLAKLRVGGRKLEDARDICNGVLGPTHPDNDLDLRKDIAIILWALEDYENNDGDKDLSRALQAMLKLAKISGPSNFGLAISGIHEAAFKLSDVRVRNTRRVILAIISYIAAVSANFVKSQLSKEDFGYATPHGIALRELYYWLIPAISLSAMVGGFPSQWTSLCIIRDLGKIFKPLCSDRHERACCERLSELTAAEPWCGGDYCFRLANGDLASFSLASLAVGTSFIFSFCMSYFTPTVGIGCRGLAEIGTLLVWIISPLFTFAVQVVLKESGTFSGFWVWSIVFGKNLVIAIAALLIQLLPLLGWWNRCSCWSGKWSLGAKQARIDLNLEQMVLEYLGNRYPIIAGCSLAAQIIITMIMYGYARDALSLDYWNDNRRRTDLQLAPVRRGFLR